ncbi:NAD-binding protein [Lentzea sp. E54]|uniref:NAD-binding protein n=1 Tax=Lentzea xerophila TaxID=3435883 RepID=UPI003DA263AD
MSGHIVTVGFGDAAQDTLTALACAAGALVVLDPDPLAAIAAPAGGAQVVRADGRDLCALRRAFVPSADQVVVAVPDDLDALLITSAARTLSDSATVIAVIREPGNRDPLIRTGADEVRVWQRGNRPIHHAGPDESLATE